MTLGREPCFTRRRGGAEKRPRRREALLRECRSTEGVFMRILLAISILMTLATNILASPPRSDKVRDELIARYGEGQRPRIERGVRQVAERWRDEDGDSAAFAAFVTTNFAADPRVLDALFHR